MYVTDFSARSVSPTHRLVSFKALPAVATHPDSLGHRMMNANRLLGVLIVLLAIPCFAEEDPVRPICATDFESPDELGLYDRLKRDKLVKVVNGKGVAGSKALRVTYRGNKNGSERIVNTFKLPEALDEATLVFDVKFDKDFQFLKGGKLHGLGPDNRVTGGDKVKPDGWSARAMWRDDGLETYVYCQDKDTRWGQKPDRKIEFQFQTQRYYSISIYVKLNDPAEKSNGSMRIYINGKGVAEDRDIRFRAEQGDHTKITHLLFSTFHGGEDPSWAPKDKNGEYKDVYAYFDNFAVYEGLHLRKIPREQSSKDKPETKKP
jgi:hypothetical protein